MNIPCLDVLLEFESILETIGSAIVRGECIGIIESDLINDFVWPSNCLRSAHIGSKVGRIAVGIRIVSDIGGNV